MECINVNRGNALGFIYDDRHGYWPNGVDSLFVNRVQEIAESYKDIEFEYIRSHKGWIAGACDKDWASGGTEYAEVMEDSTWGDDDSRYESNYSEIDRILEIAKKHGVVVIGVIFPVSPYYKKTGSYSRHGMRRSTAKMLVERLEKLAENTENFVLLDENKMGNHDYTGMVASEYDHLCSKGAKKLTQRLDSLIKTLEKR